jgi:hypothetical protein
MLITPAARDAKPLLNKLAGYAKRYQTRAEQAGRGTQYPTVRQCARALRVSQATIDDLLDHHNEEFDRLYWHTSTRPKPGDWMVEYYGTSLLH